MNRDACTAGGLLPEPDDQRGRRGPLRSTERPAPGSRAFGSAYRVVRRGGQAARRRIVAASGGPARTRIVLVLGSVLALSSADAATVGAAAVQLRHSLGHRQHRHRAARGRDLGGGGGVLGAVRRARRPGPAHLDASHRDRDLGRGDDLGRDRPYVRPADGGPDLARRGDRLHGARGGLARRRLDPGRGAGEDLRLHPDRANWPGPGVGFAVTGDIAALSWRAAFIILALPAFFLAWLVFRLPEPARGGQGRARSRAGL